MVTRVFGWDDSVNWLIMWKSHLVGVNSGYSLALLVEVFQCAILGRELVCTALSAGI